MKSIIEEASSLAKAFSQAWERAGKPQECSVKILAESEKNFIGMTTKSAKIAIFFNEPAPTQSKKGSAQSSPSRASSSQQKHTPVQTQQQSRAQVERQQPSRTSERPRQEARPVEQRSNEQRTIETRSTEQRSVEQRPRQQRHEQRPVEQHSNEQRPTSPRDNSHRESTAREQVKHDITPRENLQRKNSSHEAPQNETVARPENATPRIRPTWTEEMNQGVQAWIQESLHIMGSADVSFKTTMSRSTLTVHFTKPIIEDLEKERLLFRSWSHLIVQHIKQEFKVHGKEFKIILKGSRN